MSDSKIFTAWIALAGAMLIWSAPPVISRYLVDYFLVAEQNLYRYVSAMVFLWAWVLIFLRGEAGRGHMDRKNTLLAIFVISLYQFCWVAAVYYIMPALMNLILRLSIILGPLIAFAFEPEERSLLRSRRFRFGAVLSIIGGIGLIAGGDVELSSSGGLKAYLTGISLSILASIMWPSYSLFAKRLSRDMHPIVIFAKVSTGATLMMLLMALVQGGDLLSITKAPAHVVAMLIVSGIMCIGIAHILYLIALKKLGMSICVLATLVSSLITYLLSYLIFQEKLSLAQWLSALPLLVGCAVAITSNLKKGEIKNETSTG